MENLKNYLGCSCRAQAFNGAVRTPNHTFPWAKNNFLEDRPVWPVSQSLDLKIDLDKKTLSGSNTIEIKVLQKAVDSFRVDSADLNIENVKIDGELVKFSVGATFVTVFPKSELVRGGKHQLRIEYICKNPRAGIYFINSDEHYKRSQQVWTQGQDDDSRYWFPSFDEPRIKSLFEMKIEVPAGFVATSNGALHRESKDGKVWTFHWKSSFSIPSYLVTLTVGQFSEIKDVWKGKPVTYLFEKGRDAEAKLSFGKTPKMLELFSQKLGVDYPFEKYTQISVSDFFFGGMENTSATTQTDATLHPPEFDDDYSSDELVSHELGHQWFGDLVTCKNWAHGWLNEGWATFLESVFKDVDLGSTDTEYFCFQEFQIYKEEDLSFRRPIVTNFYSDPAEVWDRHIYQKGGLVLRALRSHLGEEDFWQGAKDYLNKFKGSVAETIDLQRCFEESSGRSLAQFFDQWIFKAGFPALACSMEWDDKQKISKFSVKQEQKLDEITPLFNIETKLEFVFSDKTSKIIPIVVSKSEESFVTVLDRKPDFVRFDSGNHILKSMKWKIPQEMIEAQLVSDTDVVGKIWAMKGLAAEPTNKGTELIISRLKSDSFWGVRAEAATCLGEMKNGLGLQALIQSLQTEKRGKVRRSICAALGQFREKIAFDTLATLIEKDENALVRSSAASALGKTRVPEAFEILKAHVSDPCWRDLITAGCINGLKALRDDRAIPIFMKYAKYGAPKFSRPNAIMALGEFGFDKKEVTDFLKDLLDDPNIRYRSVASDALAMRKDPSTIGAMESMAHRVVEGHLRTSVFRSIHSLRASLDKPKEIQEFRETIEKLQDDNRKMKDRLDSLERK